MNSITGTLALEEPDVYFVAIRPGVMNTSLQTEVREKGQYSFVFQRPIPTRTLPVLTRIFDLIQAPMSCCQNTMPSSPTSTLPPSCFRPRYREMLWQAWQPRARTCICLEVFTTGTTQLCRLTRRDGESQSKKEKKINLIPSRQGNEQLGRGEARYIYYIGSRVHTAFQNTVPW
jgi:hypothetical protein